MSRATTLALLFIVLAGRDVTAQDLVLTNANIVDPRTRTIERGDLWIENGRIAGRGRRAPRNARGERIDLGGRYVMPGLFDAHTHSFGNVAPGNVFDGFGTESTAVRVLRAGVTGFLDLFGGEDQLFALRDRQRAGAVGGADIFAAGPCFTATRGHCSEYGLKTRIIDTPDDARRELAGLAPKRPDVVKVVYDHFDYGPSTLPTIDHPTLEALLAAARERGIPTVVHVGTWDDVRHAVEAGATAVTHVPRDGVVPADVPPLMASTGTFHIPTLSVHLDLTNFLDDSTLVGAPLLVALTSDTLRAMYRRGMAGVPERTKRWVEFQRAGRPAIMESVRRLHAGGVRMLTGTDAGNWGVIHGYSVHREMAHLAAAGLGPWDVLAAATTSAGDFLRRTIGVRAGDDATLVVLEASPVEDIANAQRVRMTIVRGRVAYRR